MGRVSRYKKTKAFDKHHRGGEYVWGTTDLSKQKKRSKTATKLLEKKLKRKQEIHNNGGFNTPVEKDDFDLKDMIVKKTKRARLDEILKSESVSSLPSVAPSLKPKAVVTANKVNVAGKTVSVSIPEDDTAEKRAVRSLNIDLKTGQTKAERKSTVENRRPGESMTAFRQRMKITVKKALSDNLNKAKLSSSVTKDESDTNVEEKLSRSQKKKEYLKMKKKAKKAKSQGNASGYDSDNYAPLYNNGNHNDNNDKPRLLTGEEAAAQISFLEQADRPPIFNYLPRGAQKKSKLHMNGADSEADFKKAAMNDEQIKAEQNSFEVMRRKVQAQYALLRAKRQSQKNNL